MNDDDNRYYEDDRAPTIFPRRRATDRGMPTIEELYEMLVESTENQAKVQREFSEEVKKLSNRIAKYNGLWEHQEKQDRMFEEFSKQIGITIDTLSNSISALANSQTLCMGRQEERAKTIEQLRVWGGWIFGLTSTFLAIILAIKSLLGTR